MGHTPAPSVSPTMNKLLERRGLSSQ